MDIVTLALANKKSKAYTDLKVDALAGGLRYKGSVDTVADLDDPKKAEKKLGNLYTVKANGHEYVYDGTNWVDLSADLDNKLNVLPKVDDPTDPGVGWPYHIPYRFDVKLDSEKANIDLYTITLDNTLTKMGFNKLLLGASTTTAGLMTATDKSKLDSAYQKPSNGIPSTDMTEAVQSSLGKADTALLEHQSLSAYRTSAAQDAIDATKQGKLTAGDNITITDDNKISATDTTYSAGTNVQINNNVISATDTTYTAGTNIDITNNVISVTGVKTFQPFPNDFVTGKDDTEELKATLADFISSVRSSSGARSGMAYLGSIYNQCTPFGYGNVECKVEYMTNAAALITVSSTNRYPYMWVCNSAEWPSDAKWKAVIVTTQEVSQIFEGLAIPEDYLTKTYSVKLVNGKLSFVEDV